MVIVNVFFGAPSRQDALESLLEMSLHEKWAYTHREEAE